MTREQNAQALADRGGIQRFMGGWIVPSQSSDAVYRVSLRNGKLCCTCPDFRRRGGPCKHQQACAIVHRDQQTKREENPNG